jgi:2-oxo-3-(phosphooxy)propyl 3-oxoalkanoate synthase
VSAGLEKPVGLRLDGTLPRGEVHKRAIEEVLITDSEQRADGVSVCAAHLPRSHRTYAPRGLRHYDLLLLLEVVRQGTIVVGHRHLGVPSDAQFVLDRVALAVEDVGALRHHDAPASAGVVVQARDVRRLAGAVAGFELRGTVDIDGRRAAGGGGNVLCLAPRDFQALRGAAPRTTSAQLGPPPLARRAAPHEVGRIDPDEVVVADLERPDAQAATATVLVDPAHPSFFDHQLDHVPATLILEAARQVAAATLPDSVRATAIPAAVRAGFSSFAELDGPVSLRAAATSGSVVTVVEQRGRTAAELTFEFVPAGE